VRRRDRLNQIYHEAGGFPSAWSMHTAGVAGLALLIGDLGAGSVTTTMPCHRLKHGRPSASEQQVGFSHTCRPRAVFTPFRHLAF